MRIKHASNFERLEYFFHIVVVVIERLSDACSWSLLVKLWESNFYDYDYDFSSLLIQSEGIRKLSEHLCSSITSAGVFELFCCLRFSYCLKNVICMKPKSDLRFSIYYPNNFSLDFLSMTFQSLDVSENLNSEISCITIYFFSTNPIIKLSRFFFSQC